MNEGRSEYRELKSKLSSLVGELKMYLSDRKKELSQADFQMDDKEAFLDYLQDEYERNHQEMISIARKNLASGYGKFTGFDSEYSKEKGKEPNIPVFDSKEPIDAIMKAVEQQINKDKEQMEYMINNDKANIEQLGQEVYMKYVNTVRMLLRQIKEEYDKINNLKDKTSKTDFESLIEKLSFKEKQAYNQVLSALTRNFKSLEFDKEFDQLLKQTIPQKLYNMLTDDLSPFYIKNMGKDRSSKNFIKGKRVIGRIVSIFKNVFRDDFNQLYRTLKTNGYIK